MAARHALQRAPTHLSAVDMAVPSLTKRPLRVRRSLAMATPTWPTRSARRRCARGCYAHAQRASRSLRPAAACAHRAAARRRRPPSVALSRRWSGVQLCRRRRRCVRSSPHLRRSLIRRGLRLRPASRRVAHIAHRLRMRRRLLQMTRTDRRAATGQALLRRCRFTAARCAPALLAPAARRCSRPPLTTQTATCRRRMKSPTSTTSTRFASRLRHRTKSRTSRTSCTSVRSACAARRCVVR